MARDIEREQVEWVFHLTGGELEDEPWSGQKYWYEGVPDYIGDAFTNDPEDTVYRTIVMQALYANVPEELDSEEGMYTFTGKAETSSGETECPHRDDADNGKLVVSGQCGDDGRCELCHELKGDHHKYIYLGDGWTEAVFRRIPDNEEEDKE